MPQQKTEFDSTCFGTIDKKNEACKYCDYSEECEEYKEHLADLVASAKVKGKSDYIEEKAELARIARGKFFGYGLTIVILIVVFW